MTLHFRYFAFGLKIDSALELPELGDPLERIGDADLSIRHGSVARYGTEAGGKRDGIRWPDSDNFWLHVEAVAHYHVRQGREITVSIEENADHSEVRGYLLGSVCGAMLLQRGFLVLHGNAIRVGEGCLVCVGDSGAGKSTLAAGFLKRGFAVLADDVVAVDATGRAIPGFARIKLWQDAADKIGFSTVGRMRVFPDIDKYNLPIESFDPNVHLPIDWIYQITIGDVEEVCIEKVKGLRRFRLLRDNTYRNEYLDGHDMLSGHLKQCSQLAGQIQLSQVVRPSKGFSVDIIIDRLLDDIATNGKVAGRA